MAEQSLDVIKTVTDCLKRELNPANIMSKKQSDNRYE